MGWEIVYYLLPNDRAEPSHDFHPSVRAAWKQADRPRAGQRTIGAQSGQSVRAQFSDRDQISQFFVYDQSTRSSIRWQQAVR